MAELGDIRGAGMGEGGGNRGNGGGGERWDRGWGRRNRRAERNDEQMIKRRCDIQDKVT